MNYFITCPPRSGSSYLGELLGLNGLPYYNELFTPEICRRRHIWPRNLDEGLNRQVIDQVVSVPNAGFKMPYNQSQPGVYADIQRRPFFKIIHIIREDVLEQMASWFFLQRFGVSKATSDGRLYGTDGKEAQRPQAPRLRIEPEEAREHFRAMCRMRWLSWFLYHETHEYIEIHMRDIFTPEGEETVLRFLGLYIRPRYIKRPNHVQTPRPMARDLISNFDELQSCFADTCYKNYFTADLENEIDTDSLF